ncbi:MAG: hypothetical protein PHF20_08505 [Halothiobacillaceae bacterium]|nr:hypothetical protein [Halothiobacillaceae bacterium]
MTETVQQRSDRLQAARDQRQRDNMLRITYEAVKEMRSMMREMYAAHLKAQQGAKK